MLVAYQTATKASHLRLHGRIAVAYRPAGRSAFLGPVVVDRVLGTPPTVALAADGTGMVAWSRHRTLKVVTIRPGGAIGRAETILRPMDGRAVVAVGPGFAATVAYAVTDTAIHGRRVSRHMRVRVVSRPRGGAFGRPRLVFESRNAGRDLLAVDRVPSGPPVGRTTVALAADGHATVLWRAGSIWASDGP